MLCSSCMQCNIGVFLMQSAADLTVAHLIEKRPPYHGASVRLARGRQQHGPDANEGLRASLQLTGEVRFPLPPPPRRRGSFGFGIHRIMVPTAVGSYGALCRPATLLPVVQMSRTAAPATPRKFGSAHL
jgi:hypothetical protein